MTLEEISEKYGIKPDTFKNQFPRTQKAILNRYGVKIIKEGRGIKANYREEFMSDNRAENIFQAVQPLKDPGFIKNDLGLPNFTFMVLMGVITTPMFVFRGTYNEFLGYIEKPQTEQNVKALKNSINELVNALVIHEIVDKTTNDDVITLSLVRKAEIDMRIGIGMARQCKELADKNGINDWINIAKVWIATDLLAKQDVYTRLDVVNMTGLSVYMVDKVAKALKDSNIYKTTRAYQSFQRCVGMKADMNNEAFYQI